VSKFCECHAESPTYLTSQKSLQNQNLKKNKINPTHKLFFYKELRKSDFLIAPENTQEQGQILCRPKK